MKTVKISRSDGFTLIETLIALAIYAVLIAALVVVNRSGLDHLSDLESRALARRALTNIITDFRYKASMGRLNVNIGRHSGEYEMSHFTYYWQIHIQRSQNKQTRLLDAEIRLLEGKDILARQRELL